MTIIFRILDGPTMVKYSKTLLKKFSLNSLAPPNPCSFYPYFEYKANNVNMFRHHYIYANTTTEKDMVPFSLPNTKFCKFTNANGSISHSMGRREGDSYPWSLSCCWRRDSPTPIASKAFHKLVHIPNANPVSLDLSDDSSTVFLKPSLKLNN